MDFTQNKGLGDTIKTITDATGITSVVNKITGGKGCGCDKRQKKLNKLVPYGKKHN